VTHAEERIREAGIIAIIRGNFEWERLVAVGGVLAEAGIRALEVTLNSRGAEAAIARLRRTLADRCLVGAGTVRTAADAERALAAGAQFLVAPNLDVASVARARRAGVPHLPGVFTATEAQAAWAAGCRLVKLFPADVLGPGYLRALRAPLDDIGFVPTGGIEPGNLGDYVRAGAVALGVGSALVSGPEQDLDALGDLATRFVRTLRDARGGVDPAPG
jgi:2-dehydro-3-deoxyphosphogluconate aldolase / (4S)-4-hydroxy-2-oxoglutarate aldolase